MARRSVLGLFREPEAAAKAVESLQANGFGENEYEVLTGTPYPEGAFGEKPVKHRLYVFPFIGGISGLSVALLLTIGTQVTQPLVTGGKPILSLPPMAIISYEGMMLGAIIFTVLGIIFESRLPRPAMGLYDRRISEGFVGVLVSCEEDRLGAAERALRDAGANDMKHDTSGGSRQ